MSDPSADINQPVSRNWIEADGLADDPVQASIEGVLQREAARLSKLQPQVLPRGAAAAAKRALAEAIVRKLGVVQEYEAWTNIRDELTKRVRPIATEETPAAAERDVADYGQRLSEPPATRSVGEMWWGRTDFGVPGGMNAEFRPDGLHLFGQRNWADGDLWKGSLQVTATFGLDPARMPSGGPGWFTSTPHCELFGQIAGGTGSLWGDNWSKCWLHIAQFVHGGPGGGRIEEGHDHRNLFFLAGDNDLVTADLPGFMLFPRVDFWLDPSHDVVIILEVRFDFQMEGGSQIWFGSQMWGQPPVHRDALLRTFQWTIQRR